MRAASPEERGLPILTRPGSSEFFRPVDSEIDWGRLSDCIEKYKGKLSDCYELSRRNGERLEFEREHLHDNFGYRPVVGPSGCRIDEVESIVP